jgi:hypothetical protein
MFKDIHKIWVLILMLLIMFSGCETECENRKTLTSIKENDTMAEMEKPLDRT